MIHSSRLLFYKSCWLDLQIYVSLDLQEKKRSFKGLNPDHQQMAAWCRCLVQRPLVAEHLCRHQEKIAYRQASQRNRSGSKSLALLDCCKSIHLADKVAHSMVAQQSCRVVQSFLAVHTSADRRMVPVDTWEDTCSQQEQATKTERRI